MKRLAEFCNVCSKSVSRFQASKMICHRCGEVACRQCIVDAPRAKSHWTICRKCEGAYN